MLFGLLAIVCAAIAGFMIYSIKEDTSTLSFVISGLFVILTVVFGVMFLTKRVNKSEDIHITE